jgi:hypothetical protein
VKEIVQAYKQERTFRSKTYPSRKNPSVFYTVTIYWGGTKERPNIDCTCPTFTFAPRSCWHVQAAWDELSPFTQNDIIHHYEIVAKPWWKGSQA